MKCVDFDVLSFCEKIDKTNFDLEFSLIINRSLILKCFHPIHLNKNLSFIRFNLFHKNFPCSFFV